MVFGPDLISFHKRLANCFYATIVLSTNDGTVMFFTVLIAKVPVGRALSPEKLGLFFTHPPQKKLGLKFTTHPNFRNPGNGVIFYPPTQKKVRVEIYLHPTLLDLGCVCVCVVNFNPNLRVRKQHLLLGVFFKFTQNWGYFTPNLRAPKKTPVFGCLFQVHPKVGLKFTTHPTTKSWG